MSAKRVARCRPGLLVLASVPAVALGVETYPKRNWLDIRDPLPNQSRIPEKKQGLKPWQWSRRWFNENVPERLLITGQRTLGFHLQQVDGDEEAFNSLTNFGTGLQRFTDIGSMNIQGKKVLGVLDFNIQLNDNRFQDPQQQQYLLNYKQGKWDLNYGTIQANLTNTNPFASFSRSLDGFVGGYQSGNLAVRAIRSLPRGSARTVVIEGNNSVGPYYLQGGRIIEGSLAVQVDGTPVKLGQDYTLDAELGTLTFVTRVIAPTSSIVVTYESFGFGGQQGQILGLGAAYDMKSGGRLSITSVSQVAGTGGSAGVRTEAFQGFGEPSTPYFLQFEPLAGSVEVRVDGIIQVQGVAGTPVGDYYFDPQNPLIFYFRRFISPNSTVIVTYRPRPTQTVDGDRSVLGLDYRLPLDKAGKSFIQYSQALGRLQSDTPQSGLARGIDSRYALGNFDLKGSIRDIPTTFVTVEQTGFNRNERSLNYGLNYNAGKYTGELTLTNSVVDATDPNAPNSAPTPSRLTNAVARLSNRTTDGLWEISHVRTRSRTTTETNLDTTGLSYSRKIGKLDSNYGIESQVGRGRTVTPTGSQQSDVRVSTARTGFTYGAGKGWAVGTRLSQSAVKVDATEGEGFDYSLFASLRGDGPWQLGLDYTVSDSGALASLGGFLNGNALGFGGNGFSGGGTTGLLSVGATSARRFSVTSNYQASDRLLLNGRWSTIRSDGLSTSNTNNNSVGLSGTYQFGKNTSLNFSWDRSVVDYLGSISDQTRASTLSGFLEGAPSALWTYRLGYTSLNTSGGQFGQDVLTLDGTVTYRINSRQRVTMVATSSRTRGYYPQDDMGYNFSYGYNLTKELVLLGRYSTRNLRNLDASNLGGAFRSGLFDLELTFDFSSR